MTHSQEPYDVNFCFPVPRSLESERVRLEPFVPSVHPPTFWELSSPHPELYDYLPFGPFESVDQFISTFIKARIQPNHGTILFAVFDKVELSPSLTPKPPSSNSGDAPSSYPMAGLLGFLNTSVHNRCTEIGFVITLPKYQRTHVTSNAVGLLLQYTLDPPSLGGLGLRRVVWQANALNLASIRAAEKMGFKREATLRWDRALPPGKEKGGESVGTGNLDVTPHGIRIRVTKREGDAKKDWVGRHTAMLSLCWDDWENGGREHVEAIIARPRGN
ncbi:hypothetical protein BDN72DRAFT_799087 [Pluteus cervinus]|uniref:Uncharacterized protein n=1 Tax=Pluteus cervinus TaxID=181527 RepID=A0ACD3APR8_9AGAR|nr:hypothetical protein BDN72DRAFT_799087 [Pluteus cervinus]